MRATFNKQTALRIVRHLRSSGVRFSSLEHIPAALAPDPAPQKRWTATVINQAKSDLGLPLDPKALNIAVPHERHRIYMAGATNTTYAAGLPPYPFIKIQSGSEYEIAIPCPELLFVELGPFMHPVEHLMLGHELCGTFTRDPEDPFNGPITYGVQPVTSAARIRAFLERVRHVHNLEPARFTARYLNDNAWSPTESLVAALLRLPIDSLGYDIGDLVLNPRSDITCDLPGAKASRVPDIMIAKSNIGINYDGLVHLDLKSIVQATMEMNAHPGDSSYEKALARTVREVREKAVDDIKRNRELSANGLSVFPVIKEDLYAEHGLDLIVAQIANMLESQTGRDVSEQRYILKHDTLAQARHRMILSLLPGKHERNIQVGRFIAGHPLSNGPTTIHLSFIEL